MNSCPICKQEFAPKRKEQVLCSVICRQKKNGSGRKGKKYGQWKNRPYKTRRTMDGHLRMYAARHPYANGRKEIHVHVMLMELKIGRQLLPTECVHHKNENKTDNRIENLELMSHAQHSKIHAKKQVKTRKRNSRGRLA